MTTTGGLVLALLSPASAHAFCGHYVGQPGSDLYSGASEVVLTRSGTTTTLTLASDYTGDLADFALLVPVPPGITEDDVGLADVELLAKVRQYSAPRYVEYSCADLFPKRGCSGIGCTDMSFSVQDDADGGGFEGEGSLDVTVEQEFVVGNYQIVVLSSGDAADLIAWLDNEGYGVSPDAEDMLGEYIDAGSQFFAAKASFTQAPLAGSFLQPLQFSYESETLGLPIRLGTLNSPGVQDLILYVISSGEGGGVAIANYPEVEIEGDCMVDTEPEDFADFFGGKLDEAFEGEDAAWATEYVWNPSGCDPCPPGGALEEGDLMALGVDDPWSAIFTRLHVRYTAEAATEDLVLYETGEWGAQQMRYIRYEKRLEGSFPVCGDGWAEDPKLCPRQSEPVDRSSAGGWLSVAFLGLLGLFGLGLRRRRNG
jgi:MYXO-CTERM domain-containing protein